MVSLKQIHWDTDCRSLHQRLTLAFVRSGSVTLVRPRIADPKYDLRAGYIVPDRPPTDLVGAILVIAHVGANTWPSFRRARLVPTLSCAVALPRSMKDLDAPGRGRLETCPYALCEMTLSVSLRRSSPSWVAIHTYLRMSSSFSPSPLIMSRMGSNFASSTLAKPVMS